MAFKKKTDKVLPSESGPLNGTGESAGNGSSVLVLNT